MSRAAESWPDGRPVVLARARAVVLGVLTLELLVLLVTGVILFFVYQPAISDADAALFGEEVRSRAELARAMTTIHGLAARVALPAAIAAGVLIVVEKRPRVGRLDVAVALGLAAIVFLGGFTGYLLPWDQLAVRTVRVGSNVRGYRPLLDGDQIRFAILGGAQVGRGTLVRWLFVHTVVVGGVIAALLSVAWRRTVRRPAVPEPP